METHGVINIRQACPYLPALLNLKGVISILRVTIWSNMAAGPPATTCAFQACNG